MKNLCRSLQNNPARGLIPSIIELNVCLLVRQINLYLLLASPVTLSLPFTALFVTRKAKPWREIKVVLRTAFVTTC